MRPPTVSSSQGLEPTTYIGCRGIGGSTKNPKGSPWEPFGEPPFKSRLRSMTCYSLESQSPTTCLLSCLKTYALGRQRPIPYLTKPARASRLAEMSLIQTKLGFRLRGSGWGRGLGFKLSRPLVDRTLMYPSIIPGGKVCRILRHGRAVYCLRGDFESA